MKKWIEYTLVTILVITFISTRIPISPIVVTIVNGYSMYPTLTPGDICIGVSKHIISPSKGDIVIYRKDHTPIIHRIISEEGDTYTIKGDNNPYPDEPVPKNRVDYVIVLRIPMFLWVPIVVIALFFYTIKYERVGVISSLVFLLILSMYFVFLAQTIMMFGSPEYKVPLVELKEVSIDKTGDVLVKLDVKNTRLVKIKECTVLGTTCNATFISNDTIEVSIPPTVYRTLYNNWESLMEIDMKIILTNGVLEGRFLANILFYPLEYRVVNNTVILKNKNILPIPVYVTEIVYSTPTDVRTTNYTITIPPNYEYKITPPQGHVKYILRYSFKGESMEVILNVNNT